jgi:hypothetical protein
MKKTILYTYLGTNGSITTPIHLEDIYYVRKVKLIAEGSRKYLTKDGEHLYKMVTIPENEIEEWREIDIIGQE